MKLSTLTSISMLIEIPKNELDTLPEEVKNELESAYTVNSGILDADEIAAELKRLYIHHITNSILSDLAEHFSLNPDTLKISPKAQVTVTQKFQTNQSSSNKPSTRLNSRVLWVMTFRIAALS